jgi:HK97 gp10 family phage protein
MSATMEIKGIKNLEKAFKRLGRKETLRIARSTMRPVAQLFAEEASKQAPVDTEDYGIQKGVLPLSIEYRIRTKRGVPFVVVGPSNNPAWTHMNLGTSVTRVAHRVERGWTKWVITGWRGGHYNRRPIVEAIGHLPAKPFMRKAFDAKVNEALELANQRLVNQVAKALIKKYQQGGGGKGK